jgi:hypothetical protein
MKTYELYFNGPTTPDEKFMHAPTPEHMYTDFIQSVYSSGYTLRNSSIKYTENKKFVTIDVSGYKHD